ncbi:MAG: hypothetical protein COV35_04210 [Alphaproteobacteria bacterium CG11_big_fil_rev_8_21_14_0_20_39_49]|nr:MAG: hypothetical protein COV35_04210 [Alphaproteobacteria bacterium CG11_big_fil_rev_8_21_14_0_20_39_49]
MSINLVEPKAKLVSYETIKLLDSAINKLSDSGSDTSDYDFTIADRAIRDIYIDWQISDYKKGIEFATRYYMTAAEILLNRQEYEAASKAIDKAVESYKDSYVITGYNSKNPKFVSDFETKIKILKERLKTEKGTIVYGIIDSLI